MSDRPGTPRARPGPSGCRLREAGEKIHELQDAVLPAEAAVVVGADFGAEMEAPFRRDLDASRPVTPAQWSAQPLWQRAAEGLARLFGRWG